MNLTTPPTEAGTDANVSLFRSLWSKFRNCGYVPLQSEFVRTIKATAITAQNCRLSDEVRGHARQFGKCLAAMYDFMLQDGWFKPAADAELIQRREELGRLTNPLTFRDVEACFLQPHLFRKSTDREIFRESRPIIQVPESVASNVWGRLEKVPLTLSLDAYLKLGTALFEAVSARQ